MSLSVTFTEPKVGDATRWSATTLAAKYVGRMKRLTMLETAIRAAFDAQVNARRGVIPEALVEPFEDVVTDLMLEISPELKDSKFAEYVDKLGSRERAMRLGVQLSQAVVVDAFATAWAAKDARVIRLFGVRPQRFSRFTELFFVLCAQRHGFWALGPLRCWTVVYSATSNKLRAAVDDWIDAEFCGPLSERRATIWAVFAMMAAAPARCVNTRRFWLSLECTVAGLMVARKTAVAVDAKKLLASADWPCSQVPRKLELIVGTAGTHVPLVELPEYIARNWRERVTAQLERVGDIPLRVHWRTPSTSRPITTFFGGVAKHESKSV